MGGEQRQRPENRRFVDGLGRDLQIGETERVVESFHGLQYEHPYGRRAYVVAQEKLLAVFFVHGLECVSLCTGCRTVLQNENALVPIVRDSGFFDRIGRR